MAFDLERCIEILSRTPKVLELWLAGLSDEWTRANEGGETWSPYDVIGHLIHGERTDWMTRLDLILSGRQETFAVFDRLAQFEESRGKTLSMLLQEFAEVRATNISRLRILNLTETDFDLTGVHPKFGTVTLRQLLATWTVHDLDHIQQISRVMAKQVGTDVGPWVEYLRILKTPLG